MGRFQGELECKKSPKKPIASGRGLCWAKGDCGVTGDGRDETLQVSGKQLGGFDAIRGDAQRMSWQAYGVLRIMTNAHEFFFNSF